MWALASTTNYTQALFIYCIIITRPTEISLVIIFILIFIADEPNYQAVLLLSRPLKPEAYMFRLYVGWQYRCFFNHCLSQWELCMFQLQSPDVQC